MNKMTLTILTIQVLTLAACDSRTNPQQSTSGQSELPGNVELTASSKLAIGSFKLEASDLAITSEQAAELLPLWQVFQQLSSSDTAAQAEIDALVEQIQETMTPGQIAAIDEMNLTQQDVFATMQEQGIQFGAGIQGNSDENSGSRFRGGQAPPDGGIPGGGPGGGGFGGGQNLSPQQIATAQAQRAENGQNAIRSRGTPAPLLGALVEFLQEKTES